MVRAAAPAWAVRHPQVALNVVSRQFADGASVMTLERQQSGDTPALSGSADKVDYLAVNRALDRIDPPD